MEHFYQKIQGWCNFWTIYNNMVELAEDGDHFVEVGAWKGQSTAFMAVLIANSGKQIKFDVVDTWEGSAEHKADTESWDKDLKDDNLYNEFLTNMKPAEGYFNPIRTTSLEAAASYEDESSEFVLLDASHEYEDVKADILAWLPKIKPGCFLGGDDYHQTWPGVIRAVTELVPGHQVVDNISWIYQKSE